MYVLFGGMLATTWVQIIKAVLLLFGASFMAFMVMKHVGFSFNNLFSEAMAVHPKGVDIMKPGGLVKDPISALSLGLGLMFGTAGLPHILMRFFTVSDAREARKSVFYATGFMGYFYILTFIIGFGAIMLVGANPEYKDAAGHLIGGNNMAAVHLANAVGGNLFLGFISAVAFATILAVVAGLTLAGASAVSHDLYANVFKKGATEREELRVSKITVLILGVIAIILGVLFENQNIAFMVGLAFAIAASCNFPIILLSMYWSKLTTRGAMMGGWLGLITAVVLMILGPTIWVQIFNRKFYFCTQSIHRDFCRMVFCFFFCRIYFVLGISIRLMHRYSHQCSFYASSFACTRHHEIIIGSDVGNNCFNSSVNCRPRFTFCSIRS